MLVVIPDTLYGRIGAVLSALIAAASVIGLTMHRDFYAGKPRRGFLFFYTNLSNLLVFLYFSVVSPYLYAKKNLQQLIPLTEFSVMMSIMLTFSVFHLILFPAVRAGIQDMPHTREYRIVLADNLIIHYIVPWLVFIYWLLCSPGKGSLRISDAILWTLLPAGYTLMILLSAPFREDIEEAGSPYPYPFLDVRVFGAAEVMRSCAALYLLAASASFAVVLLLRILIAFWGDGHALILI